MKNMKDHKRMISKEIQNLKTCDYSNIQTPSNMNTIDHSNNETIPNVILSLETTNNNFMLNPGAQNFQTPEFEEVNHDPKVDHQAFMQQFNDEYLTFVKTLKTE